jgi:hypothetical protein
MPVPDEGFTRLTHQLGFSESMQADPSGEQSWVNYQEPHSDPNHRANNDQNANPT